MSSVEAYSNVPPPLGFGGPADCGYDAISTIDQAVLEAFPTAICICSADGTLVRFNRLAIDLWGRTPGPARPANAIYSAFASSQLDGTLLLDGSTPMEIALRTGEPQRDQGTGDREARRFAGRRPDEHRVLKSDSRVIQGAINCFQDITARKRDEQLIRENEQHSRQVLDVLPAAVYTTDAEGTLTYFNAAAMELAGNKRRAWQGQMVRELAAAPARRNAAAARRMPDGDGAQGAAAGRGTSRPTPSGLTAR